MKHINKSLIYDVLLPWFNTGLLTSGGKIMRVRLKNIISVIVYEFYYYILL